VISPAFLDETIMPDSIVRHLAARPDGAPSRDGYEAAAGVLGLTDASRRLGARPVEGSWLFVEHPPGHGRMRGHMFAGLCAAMLACTGSPASAEVFTLQYLISIEERAQVVPIGTTPVDPRVNLSLGPSELFHAAFFLTMTFVAELGHSESGSPPDRVLTTTYGQPTFSAIPLPKAVPLVFSGDPGTEINLFGQAFDQQSWVQSDGSSSTNWGAYIVDTVQRQGDVQSGSNTLLSSRRPAGFTNGFDFQLIPLGTYLDHMQGPLDFDFVTWTYFYPTDSFTADSYNYRGTAQFVAIPEPSTALLLAVGLAISRRLRRYGSEALFRRCRRS
jgi:hypothetical protein